MKNTRPAARVTSCSSPFSRWVVLAVAALLAIGIWVRVAHLGLRTLRGDEEWFADLVFLPTWSEVMSAIATHVQAIPAPLFVAVEFLAAKLWGAEPFSLRLLPAFAGIVCLPAIFLFARRFVSLTTSALLLLLIACSPFFVYWSKDAKPYTLELACFLLQALCFERVRERAYATSWLVLLIALSCFTAAISYASFFSFPALALIAAIDVCTRDRKVRWRAALLVLLLASLVIAVYFGWVRLRRNAYLDQFWLYYFAPIERPHDWIEWHLWRLAHLPNRLLLGSYAGLLGTLEYVVAGLSWMIFGLGVSSLWRRLPWRFYVYAWLPFLLCYVASVASLFPFEDRLLLFAMALPALFFVVGLQVLWNLRWHGFEWLHRSALILAAMAFLAWPIHSEILLPATGTERSALEGELAQAVQQSGGAQFVWYELATNPSQFYFDYQPKRALQESWISLPGWFGFPYRDRHAAAVRSWLGLSPDHWAILVFSGDRGYDLEQRAIIEEVERDRRRVQQFSATHADAYLFAPVERSKREE